MINEEKWDSQIGFKMWRKERDEACLSFDLDTFKRFYRRWIKLGVYEDWDMSDEVMEISMRKMVCELASAPKEKKEEAKAWLKERGYKAGL